MAPILYVVFVDLDLLLMQLKLVNQLLLVILATVLWLLMPTTVRLAHLAISCLRMEVASHNVIMLQANKLIIALFILIVWIPQLMLIT